MPQLRTSQPTGRLAPSLRSGDAQTRPLLPGHRTHFEKPRVPARAGLEALRNVVALAGRYSNHLDQLEMLFGDWVRVTDAVSLSLPRLWPSRSS